MSHISRNVRIKRIYDAPSPDDGLRILITRYWPRGIQRELADEYDTKVAPSRELLREFKHEGLSWEPYTKRYLHEMESDESQRDIDLLAEVARTRTITLMCVCEDETHCHRSLARNLIIQRMVRHLSSPAQSNAIERGNNRAVQAQPAGGAGVSPVTTSRAGGWARRHPVSQGREA